MVVTVHISPTQLREISEFMNFVKGYNNGELYVPFKLIIHDYEQQRSNLDEASSRMEKLFKNYSQLAQGYNHLRKESTFNYFHAKLWDRLAIKDNQRYLAVFEILRGFRSGQKTMAKMAEELSVLLDGHLDLFLDFCAFLPRELDFEFDDD